jgi:hypothetical protein
MHPGERRIGISCKVFVRRKRKGGIEMSNSCKDCQSPIDWNSKARERLNTRRPLNPDGTIHSCNLGSRSSNPTPAIAKTINETDNKGGGLVRSILSTDNKQEDEVLGALALEFKTLLKHVSEYLKNKNGWLCYYFKRRWRHWMISISLLLIIVPLLASLITTQFEYTIANDPIFGKCNIALTKVHEKYVQPWVENRAMNVKKKRKGSNNT